MTETLTTERIEDWNTLHAALGNLKTAANYCQGNIAEFGHITDGEIVDLLDKAIEQASAALALALGRQPVDAELLALRKRVEELEAWQDISTAPRDGARFLAGRFSDPNYGYMVVDRWHSRALGDAWDGLGKFNDSEPATHWKPLPVPPLPTPKEPS